MRIAATSAGRGGRLIVAAIAALASFPAMAPAQFFDLPLRPPADVPGATPGPAQNLAPPAGPVATPPAPKGPMLQALPPAGTAPSAAPTPPALPSGPFSLSVIPLFGRDLHSYGIGQHCSVHSARAEC